MNIKQINKFLNDSAFECLKKCEEIRDLHYGSEEGKNKLIKDFIENYFLSEYDIMNLSEQFDAGIDKDEVAENRAEMVITLIKSQTN